MVSKYLRELGLDPKQEPTPDGIKKAWKALCKIHHPDIGGDPEKFHSITHAYKMLTDPSYRREEEQQNRNKKSDLNMRFQVPVNFEDAFFGRKVVLTFNRLEFGKDMQPVVKEEQEVLSFTIDLPEGCCDGHEIIRQGAGAACEGEFGDLFVRFIPSRHPRFQVRGPDVFTEEQVPLDIMLKGGEIEVQTMWGLRTVKVKPGTQPSEKLEIKKGGVAKIGNHYAVVKPLYPNRSDLKSSAWKGLDINWKVEEEEDLEANEFEQIFVRLGRRARGEDNP